MYIIRKNHSIDYNFGKEHESPKRVRFFNEMQTKPINPFCCVITTYEQTQTNILYNVHKSSKYFFFIAEQH